MKQSPRDADVVIIGGGHAGAEAALASARMGLSTILVTAVRDAIARMPCNPSIGGLAKSHLVYEIDALGGEMGINADATALQAKTLNISYQITGSLIPIRTDYNLTRTFEFTKDGKLILTDEDGNATTFTKAEK